MSTEKQLSKSESSQDADESTEEEKKEDVLNFISNNSSKEEFVGWLLNNTESTVSDENNWVELKEDLLEDNEISVHDLRDYSATLNQQAETEDAVRAVKEETEKAEEVVRKLSFVGRLKKFSIAIGGIVLFLGIIKLSAAAILLLVPPLAVTIALDTTTLIALGVFLVLSGLVEILGGLFLMTI